MNSQSASAIGTVKEMISGFHEGAAKFFGSETPDPKNSVFRIHLKLTNATK